MDYTALKTLLDSDPANASKTDVEAAEWCNEKAFSVIGKASIATIASRWLNSGAWDAILGAAADTGHAAHTLAKTVVTAIREARNLGLENFDFALARPNALLTGLRDAGFIDQAEVDAIVALATRQISRVENDPEVGTTSVTHIDIAIARGRG